MAFQPSAIEGCVKYGFQGLSFEVRNVDIRKDIVADLSGLAEHSIAKKTWSTYQTAERMLGKFCKEKKVTLILPVNEKTVLEFVHWLVFERGLTAATVSGYLAGVKKLHVIKGVPEPNIRTNLVKMVIEGKKNLEAASRAGQPHKRPPVTPDIMLLLKAKISGWDAVTADKLTVWAVCTLLFHGAFRGGEILARNVAWYDPAFTLLRRDICFSEDKDGGTTVQILVKAPKESKSGAGTVVDIFQTDTAMCPAKATKKWWGATRGMSTDMPAFRFACGTPLTSAKLNALLHSWLDDTVQGISTHSFRIGVAWGNWATRIKMYKRWADGAAGHLKVI
jgi:hypothetical protein